MFFESKQRFNCTKRSPVQTTSVVAGTHRMYFRPAFTYVRTCQYWSPRRHSELDSSASVEKMSRVHKVNALCIHCSVHKPTYMHCTYCIAGNFGEGFNLAPNLKVVNIIIIAKSMFFCTYFPHTSLSGHVFNI